MPHTHTMLERQRRRSKRRKNKETHHVSQTLKLKLYDDFIYHQLSDIIWPCTHDIMLFVAIVAVVYYTYTIHKWYGSLHQTDVTLNPFI